LRRVLGITLAVGALAAAGCGGDDSEGDGSSVTAGSNSAAKEPSGGSPGAKTTLAGQTQRAAPGTTVKADASQFGRVLFGGRDRAIYYFDKETTSRPECYGGCARAWPPVLTKGRPQAGGPVKQGLLGTKRRNNGKKQVTYAGHPLYYYVNDPRGVVGCHNVEEFGGLWLAVKPSGKPVG
jgi:predicted lipoprotein with Yx(FWY)xxD motif